MVLLHVISWDGTDRFYGVPRPRLLEFKDKIIKDGLVVAWRWFTRQVDYTLDACVNNKPIKHMDSSVVVDRGQNVFLLNWSSPESVSEWTLP